MQEVGETGLVSAPVVRVAALLRRNRQGLDHGVPDFQEQQQDIRQSQEIMRRNDLGQ